MSGDADVTSKPHAPASDGVFGDVAAKIATAVDEEVAERKRRGLPVVVDRGAGVEDLAHPVA